VYGIVSRHQGEISVISEEGCGATFRIAFPVYEPVPAVQGGSETDAPECRRARVLLVDDEDLVREMFQSALATAGHHVRASATGAEALSLFTQERFDIVITDLSLPGMSGFEIAHRVKSIEPRTPVVLLSGWAIQQDSVEARDAGVDVVLEKPCTLEVLLGTVQTALRSSPADSTPETTGTGSSDLRSER